MSKSPGLKIFVFILFFALVSKAGSKPFVQPGSAFLNSLNVSGGASEKYKQHFFSDSHVKNAFVFEKRKGKSRGIGASMPNISTQTGIVFFTFLQTKPQLSQAEIFSSLRYAQFNRGPPLK